MTVIPVIL